MVSGSGRESKYAARSSSQHGSSVAYSVLSQHGDLSTSPLSPASMGAAGSPRDGASARTPRRGRRLTSKRGSLAPAPPAKGRGLRGEGEATGARERQRQRQRQRGSRLTARQRSAIATCQPCLLQLPHCSAACRCAVSTGGARSRHHISPYLPTSPPATVRCRPAGPTPPSEARTSGAYSRRAYFFSWARAFPF